MTILHIWCREEIKVDVKKELLRIKDKVYSININHEKLDKINFEFKSF